MVLLDGRTGHLDFEQAGLDSGGPNITLCFPASNSSALLRQ
jgi:hypothetical protein